MDPQFASGEHPVGMIDSILILIDTDEDAIRGDLLADTQGMSTSAQGAVDNDLARPAGQHGHGFVEHGGDMVRRHGLQPKLGDLLPHPIVAHILLHEPVFTIPVLARPDLESIQDAHQDDLFFKP